MMPILLYVKGLRAPAGQLFVYTSTRFCAAPKCLSTLILPQACLNKTDALRAGTCLDTEIPKLQALRCDHAHEVPKWIMAAIVAGCQ